MSHLKTISYDFNKNTIEHDKQVSYTYQGEDVQIITIFKDINTAIVENNQGKIFEISVDELQ